MSLFATVNLEDILDGSMSLKENILLSWILDFKVYPPKNGILHHDLKLENVLIQVNHLLIADFGLAKMADTAEWFS